jgi:hypothetical protein
MIRFIALLMLAGNAYAADATVDIDTVAKIYQAAGVREQVRAALPTMPKQIRDMFSRDVSAQLSDEQLAAVSAAAARGFRIDVFETPALEALAHNLDSPSVAKIQAFLASDLGKRMVAADVEAATMGEANIDKVMNGQLTAPSTPKRDALFEKLERATKSTESTVRIFLSMGQAVALGTAIGSGLDQNSVAERAQKSGEASRAGLEEDMRLPMQRFLTYSYRNLSDSDLKHLLAFGNFSDELGREREEITPEQPQFRGFVHIESGERPAPRGDAVLQEERLEGRWGDLDARDEVPLFAQPEEIEALAAQGNEDSA